MKFLNRGDVVGSEAYILRLFEYAKTHPGSIDQAEMGGLQSFLGALAFDQDNFPLALERWRAYVANAPEDRATHFDMARAYLALDDIPNAAASLREVLRINRADPSNLAQLGRFLGQLGQREEAVSLLRESLALSPNGTVHFELAKILFQTGNAASAATELEKIVQEHPRWAPACNNLAWIRATAKDAGLRDGAQAVRLATIATEARNGKVASSFGTLSAAQAEAGNFQAAIDAVQHAIALSKEQGDEKRIGQLEEMLARYHAGQPYRDQ